MKLNTYQPKVNLPLYLQPKNWSSKPELNLAEPESHSSTWVKLQQPPSPYSYDEALLLCKHSDTEWIAWVPDYGEILLDQCQFSELSE